jgi:SAM-dependent methyltransferase
VNEHIDTARFYDELYAAGDPAWRALGARGKADHVETLVARVSTARGSAVEIGCGDGALLAELERRRIFEELSGFDVSARAVQIAGDRALSSVRTLEVFDGSRLPVADRSYDVAILSHVLEHVAEPRALLVEAARVAPWVIVEVPLEDNLSGRRASKRSASEGIGHIQELSRPAVRALLAEAGLGIRDDLLDPLPTAVHTFFATTSAQRARGRAKAAVRRAAFGLSPRLAERVFTLHYACAARS